MKRYYIVVGDKTTAGGTVVSGEPTHTWHDKPCAFEGDKIECPVCKSTGMIQCSGSRIPFTGVHGREAALNGDLCICGCHPPPRLIESQHTFSTEGESDGGMANYGQANCSSFASQSEQQYDQSFIFVTADGKPVPNLNYRAEINGDIACTGASCSQGLVNNISTGLQQEQIILYIEG